MLTDSVQLVITKQDIYELYLFTGYVGNFNVSLFGLHKQLAKINILDRDGSLRRILLGFNMPNDAREEKTMMLKS